MEQQDAGQYEREQRFYVHVESDTCKGLLLGART
jgi:hypothetical protein